MLAIDSRRVTLPGTSRSVDSKSTTTSLRPSEKTASTAIPLNSGPTPGNKSASVTALIPACRACEWLAPSRADSITACEIKATASGLFSFTPRALRDCASWATLKIKSRSSSEGVNSTAQTYPDRSGKTYLPKTRTPPSQVPTTLALRTRIGSSE